MLVVQSDAETSCTAVACVSDVVQNRDSIRASQQCRPIPQGHEKRLPSARSWVLLDGRFLVITQNPLDEPVIAGLIGLRYRSKRFPWSICSSNTKAFAQRHVRLAYVSSFGAGPVTSLPDLDTGKLSRRQRHTSSRGIDDLTHWNISDAIATKWLRVLSGMRIRFIF